MKKFQGSGSIGLISSKLTLEGPIIKDRTSFIISARRTYLDVIAQPLIREIGGGDEFTSQGYYFYDLNAKVNHIPVKSLLCAFFNVVALAIVSIVKKSVPSCAK